MKQIYYCKINDKQSGLCNQIFAFITGIIIAKINAKKIVIVDVFLNDYLKNIVTPISHIINLEKLNVFLKQYDICVLDKYYTKLNIHKVTYGIERNYIDVTKIITDKFYKNNTFGIHSYENLHLLGFNDPLPGRMKYLEITYSLNNMEFIDKYNESGGFLKEPILFNLNNTFFNYKMGWINKYNKEMFDNILKNISFFKKFNLPQNECQKIKNFSKINIIHLRLENDAIIHWSKMNHMHEVIFENYIYKKYINIIQENINKNDMTVILSGSTHNPVINYLIENRYNYHISEKINEWGREINAIRDASSIEMCNNVFIGNFNLNKLNGSTLSYYLIKKLSSNIKCITIDLDRITDPPVTFVT